MKMICKVCNSEMKEIHSGKSFYWFCENCGNIVKPKKVKKIILPKENLPKALRRRIKDKYNIDIPDTFDLDNNIDSSLSLEENLRIIEKKLKNLIPDLVENVDKDYIEHLETEQKKREEEYYKKEFEKKIEKIKKSEIKELEPYFSNYHKHIESFLENKRVKGLLILGNGGIGKSFNLFSKLKEKNISFRLLKSHISALSFYRFLYENRNNQLIVIDDIIKLISDKDIVGMLLSALDYDNSQVEWLSNSYLTKDLPEIFDFNSKIIILANGLKEEDEFIRALKDRCVFYKLEFTKEQIIEMSYILAKSRNYPLELVDYIKELSESNVIKNLSLRLLDKIYTYYNKENWKNLIKQIIEIDETENLVFELIRSGKTVKEQVKEFIEKSGYSRRTYFRIKKKLVSKCH